MKVCAFDLHPSFWSLEAHGNQAIVKIAHWCITNHVFLDFHFQQLDLPPVTLVSSSSSSSWGKIFCVLGVEVGLFACVIGEPILAEIEPFIGTDQIICLHWTAPHKLSLPVVHKFCCERHSHSKAMGLSHTASSHS